METKNVQTQHVTGVMFMYKQPFERISSKLLQNYLDRVFSIQLRREFPS